MEASYLTLGTAFGVAVWRLKSIRCRNLTSLIHAFIKSDVFSLPHVLKLPDSPDDLED